MAKDSAEWAKAQMVAAIMDLQWPREKFAERLMEMSYNEGWADGMRHAIALIEEQKKEAGL